MKSVNAIGGYFELELPAGREFYPDLIQVNSGRNALEYILLAKGYKKIYVPFFTCSVVLEPFHKHNIEYEFYHINDQLEIQNIPTLRNDEAILYTNYFGLKNKYVNELNVRVPRLILDNAQAFFSSPLRGVDTFYSPRKFFGLPDGGYVYTEASLDIPLTKDYSFERVAHLLLRIEKGPEAGFQVYKENDKSLIGQAIKKMSNLTQDLLSGIDYQSVREQRNSNFLLLHEKLRHLNKFLWLDGAVIDGPMVYPLYVDSNGLRDWLIQNRVFVATYWPNVLADCNNGSLEYELASKIISLPVDQRYQQEEMDIIVKLIERYYEHQG